MRLRIATIAVGLMLAAAPFAHHAEAARGDSRSEARSSQPRAARTAAQAPSRRSSTARRSSSGGISCVPYARSITGIQISGNGRDWWENAAGRYARGQRPQIGSILSFPSSGGMRSGHVAVVSRVVQPRMIEIDHANWGGPGIRRGTVMQNIRVIDVSSDNSWTRVRVQVGWDSTTFGREYPTDGFIHNRAAGTYIAGADDMVRPVSYTTRTETRSSRNFRPAQARNTQRARSQAVSARTSQPARVASARSTR